MFWGSPKTYPLPTPFDSKYLDVWPGHVSIVFTGRCFSIVEQVNSEKMATQLRFVKICFHHWLVVSKIFLCSSLPVETIRFDLRIFFRWVGSTTNQIILPDEIYLGPKNVRLRQLTRRRDDRGYIVASGSWLMVEVSEYWHQRVP